MTPDEWDAAVVAATERANAMYGLRLVAKCVYAGDHLRWYAFREDGTGPTAAVWLDAMGGGQDLDDMLFDMVCDTHWKAVWDALDLGERKAT